MKIYIVDIKEHCIDNWCDRDITHFFRGYKTLDAAKKVVKEWLERVKIDINFEDWDFEEGDGTFEEGDGWFKIVDEEGGYWCGDIITLPVDD